jgi:tetratricopeptide (TPR) repeat protein
LTDPALLRQLEVLLDSQRCGEALELLERRKSSLSRPQERILMGDLLRRVGRSAEAIACLRELIGELPGSDPATAHMRSLAWGILGLAHRNLGQFRRAAEALLDGIEAEPMRLSPYHALQFTRLKDADIAALLPRLAAAAGQADALPLPQQLLAEWERRCGREQDALRRSYRAAQASCTGEQRSLLDLAASPLPPDALIIGAPKCGTTSLMAWLNRHPRVWAHPRKELHFFDNNWAWGAQWYASQFPVFRPGSGIVRLEATPNLFQLPECPGRVKATLPEARLILLLRDPLQRALSWIHHMQRQEGLRGDPAILLERERAELSAMTAEKRQAIGWRAPNGLAGSLYASFLPRWQACFPPDRLLVLCLEDLTERTDATLGRLQEFLHLPLAESCRNGFPQHNRAPAPYAHLPQSLTDHLNKGILASSRRLWSSFRIV